MTSTFFANPSSLQLNKARLNHLYTLELPIEGKTVNEYGAGAGLLTPFFLSHDCTVRSYESRLENIVSYKENIDHPNASVFETDLEEENWKNIKNSQIGFAYGLLYHLENPKNFIKNVSEKTEELVILETVVLPDTENVDYISLTENKEWCIQSFSGNACRPTRKFVWETFKQYFPYVYVPKTQPDSIEFPLDFQNPSNSTIRFIIIASKHPLDNKNLSDTLLTQYSKT